MRFLFHFTSLHTIILVLGLVFILAYPFNHITHISSIYASGLEQELEEYRMTRRRKCESVRYEDPVKASREGEEGEACSSLLPVR